MALRTDRFVPSRYNALSPTGDGGVIVSNTYTGAIAAFSKEEKPQLMSILHKEDTEPSSLLEALKEQGFMVDERIDEGKRASYLHQSLHRTDYMHLIIMPTEACNFRCVYCYQDFAKGTMQRQVQAGVVRFVEERARYLDHLSISWFGGEPLLALGVIKELSERFIDIAERYEINYSADISTNGYGLTPDVFQELLRLKVNRFMVTVDGLPDVHDTRRVLANGGETFSRIVENLTAIRELPGDFTIDLRINFDEESLEPMPEYIAYLGRTFAGDPRIQPFFRPVGRWGGKRDDQLPVCDARTAESKIFELTEEGLKEGMPLSSQLAGLLQPGGAVCYAAKPQSLVIGSDGKLYKCTCALDEDFNQIGFIREDGTAEIDHDLMALWVGSGEETDETCRSCFFRPACQGNYCPLYRFRTGKRPCPSEKKQIKRTLSLIWEGYSRSE